MTENEAIKILDTQKQCLDESSSGQCKIRCADCRMNIPITYQEKAIKIAISVLKEIQQYREIGTVEECKKAVKEEDTLKFYYCESEDDYYIGKRVGNFYYARYAETGFEWFMSRYLPWGEHVVKPNTLWKEYTYPSEPKEIPFFEWLQGFVKKYCGGTVEECREALEKQKSKKIIIKNWSPTCCPTCGHELSTSLGDGYYKHPTFLKMCPACGQAIQWHDNLEADNHE